FLYQCHYYHCALHSFPTRRSSDLGIGDLSESGRGQLRARFVKLRRIEEVDEFAAKVERTVPARQTEVSAKRDIPVGCSVFPERVPPEIAAASGGNVGIEILAAQVGEAIGARRPASIGTQ